jgi:HK97 family phage prohead protease
MVNHLNLTIKANPTGAKTYTAVAWDGGITDRQGEKFSPDTFDLHVLQKHSLPLLFNHDSNKIVGAIDSAKVVDEKLMITFRLSETPLGQEMATLIAEQALNTCSVGFIARRGPDGTFVRELVEVSLTPTPANAGAVITQRSISSSSSGDINMSGPALIRSKSEQQNYSVSRFLLGLADPLQAKNSGFEFEVSRELARLSGKSSDAAMIPWSVLAKKSQETTTTTSPDFGASLAQPLTDPAMFTIAASATFKSSVTARAGVQFHQAPATSEYKVPRMLSSVVTDFVARDTNLGESSATFDTISAFPKTAGGLVRILRSAIVDANPSMEALILAELRKSIADTIDNCFLGELSRTNLNRPKGMLEILSGGANDVGPIADGKALHAMIRKMQVADDSGKLTLISGNGFTSWAATQSAGASLSQTPLLSPDSGRIYGQDVTVVTTSKLDVNSSGAISDTVPLLLGQPQYCHLVQFGGGVEIGVNGYGTEDWARGSLLTRVLTDLDFITSDDSRWSIGSVSLA